MFLPKLPHSTNAKTKKSTIEFAGINRTDYQKENEFSDTYNLSSKSFPLASPRESRSTAYALTSGKALFASTQLAWVDSLTFTSPANDITFGTATITSASSAFGGISVGDTLVITGCTVNAGNNKSAVVVIATAAILTFAAATFTAGAETAALTFTGCSFKYNNVSKGPVTATAKSMVELSSRIVIFPDKKSYDTVGGTFGSFGTGTYPTAGAVPDIDYATTLDNRIWGVKGDNIYCTALGDFDDWTTFSSPSEATDAWSVDTGTNGNFTGIASYKGTNVVFKIDRVYKRFGDIPANFQFVEISRLGCISHKSICEVNNILFWLSPQGVVAYTGGIPEVIGEALNVNYVSAVAGGDGRKYYISLYNGTTYSLYVYDTWKGVWLREDDLNVTEFCYFGGYLYALTSENEIVKFADGTEKVEWYFVTKTFTEEVSGKKGYSELSIRASLASGSSLQVYVKINNGSFELLKSYSVSDLSSLVIPIRIKRADHFTIKLAGTGEVTIHSLERTFCIGSNV